MEEETFKTSWAKFNVWEEDGIVYGSHCGYERGCFWTDPEEYSFKTVEEAQEYLLKTHGPYRKFHIDSLVTIQRHRDHIVLFFRTSDEFYEETGATQYGYTVQLEEGRPAIPDELRSLDWEKILGTPLNEDEMEE